MKFKYFNHLLSLPVLLIVLIVNSCSKKGDPVVNNKPPDTTTTKPLTYNYSLLADSLQAATYNTFISADRNYFVQNNNGTTTFNYWPQAHMLDVLLDGYLRTKNAQYTARMKALLDGIKIKNGGAYPNEFYDDMGWLANASVRAYNTTNDADYLNVAQILYTEIKGGVNNNAGG